jgi:hypothetical protein
MRKQGHPNSQMIITVMCTFSSTMSRTVPFVVGLRVQEERVKNTPREKLQLNSSLKAQETSVTRPAIKSDKVLQAVSSSSSKASIPLSHAAHLPLPTPTSPPPPRHLVTRAHGHP